MAWTMTLYKTSEFEHKEIAHVHYMFTSLSKEYEIAHQLNKSHNGQFIVILDNDGAPIRSIYF